MRISGGTTGDVHQGASRGYALSVRGFTAVVLQRLPRVDRALSCTVRMPVNVARL